MARRTKLSQPLLSAGFGLKAQCHGVGKTLELHSEFWVVGFWASCADDDSWFPGFPGSED